LGGRHRPVHADLSSLATKYRSGVLMQRDLRPERAAIERRSSPRPPDGQRAGAGAVRGPAARANRPRSAAAEPVSEMDLKRTSAEKDVDAMHVVITEN